MNLKNILQWILLLGGIYFFVKKLKDEKSSGSLGTPAIQKVTKKVMLD
ncbi:MAG: hypothetical protein IT232_08560 [Flavobacteriales bacterium]|nr:hypothetical protein [Flavobacteriales bacterium]